LARTNSTSAKYFILNEFSYGAGRGGRTPMTARVGGF
jgi:hypothetical protein